MLNGKIELAAKAPASAFNAFVTAWSLDPANREALRGIATTGLQTGHPREAEDAMKALLAIDPNDPVAVLTGGLLALDRKQFDQAVSAADKVLAQQPADEQALVLKIRAQYLAGQHDQALATLRAVGPLDRAPAGVARIALEVARADADAPAMLKAFAALRAHRVMTPQLALDEANLRYKTGDRAGGDRIVLDQLGQAKTTPEQARDLVGLWHEYGPPPVGTVRLPSASAVAAREEVARYLVSLNRGPEALAVLAIAPSPNAEGIKALALLNQGQEEGAAQLAQRIKATDPAQCEARLVRARLALRARLFEGAVTEATQVAAECPGQVDATFTLALAYRALGQSTQVDRVFGEAIARDPADARIYGPYTEWLKAAGQIDRAAPAVRRLTRAAPSRPSSWRLLLASCGNDATCKGEAKAGQEAAARAYRIDPHPGALPPKGLFAPLPAPAA